MFQENNDHLQASFLDADNLMTERSRKRLEKSWAVPFYKNVFLNIDESRFAPLYSHTGAPNTPVNILMSLELFKYMFVWSDDQLLDEYDFNYLVNYAVGNRQLGQKPISEKTLYNFRSRYYQFLLDHPDEESPIFGQFLVLLNAYAKSANVKMSSQRLDTTLFMSNIKKSGRLSLCFDILEQAVSSIPGKDCTEPLKQVFDIEFRKSVLDLALISEKESRLSILIGLCFQAKRIIEQQKGYQKQEIYKRLVRFIQEQTISNPDGSYTIKDNKDILPGTLQSAYDDGATFRAKAGKRYIGYVAGITETCDKENPIQLITDIDVQSNVKSDTAIFRERQAHIVSTGAKDLYVDGGFHYTSDTDDKNPLHMHYTNMTGTPPSVKMDASAFTFDADHFITQCPAGKTPTRISQGNGQTNAHFDIDTCRSCPMNKQCPAKLQKKSAIVYLTLKKVRVSEIRKDTKDNQVEYTSMRAAIEGTNSAIKRTGMAKMKVRGLQKCQTVAIFMAIAQNTKRSIRHWFDPMKKERLAQKKEKLSTARANLTPIMNPC